MIDRRYMTRWVLPFAGLLLMAQGARSQQPVRTTLSLTTKAGYLTNAYLAPAYPVWEQTARAPFVSVKPRAGLTWSGGGQRLSLWGSGQLTFFPEDGRRWKLGQGQLRYALVFSDSWSGGLYGAATRSQTTFGQWLFWGAPYARWQITSRFRLELQAGATAQRYDAGARPAGNFQRTTSPFVTVTSGWRRGRWSAEGRLYYSRTVETATDGLGLALQAARQLTDVLRVGLSAGADQYAFPPDAAASSGEPTPARSDHLLHTAATARWTPRTRWTLSARLGIQRYRTEADLANPSDVYASIGLTYRWTSGDEDKRSAASEDTPRALWVQDAEQIRLRIPYEGEGRLYLVGDFNDWRRRDRPLRETSDGIYTTIFTLAPGTYQYRVQVVEAGASRWLPFPDHALTVEDGFGAKNGVITVE
jgi:hypothetical protein